MGKSEKPSDQTSAVATQGVNALSLLRIMASPSPAIPEFAALWKFQAGVDKESGVHIAFVSNGFRKHYGTKIENIPVGRSLYGYKMLSEKFIEDVIDTFGGFQEAETNLYDIWKKLERQPDGQTGDLLTDGRINTFFVVDVFGALYPVRLRYLAGWHVFMSPDEKKRVCEERTQVFSHQLIM